MGENKVERICIKIVKSFKKVFFGYKSTAKEYDHKKDEYTLSSVFPTQKIMRDVKKIL